MRWYPTFCNSQVLYDQFGMLHCFTGRFFGKKPNGMIWDDLGMIWQQIPSGHRNSGFSIAMLVITRGYGGFFWRILWDREVEVEPSHDFA